MNIRLLHACTPGLVACALALILPHSYAAEAETAVPDLRNLSVAATPASPPPPTIADLVLLLRSYQPDAQRVARLREERDKPVDESAPAADRAIAWARRAYAAEELQDVDKRTEYLRRAIEASAQTTLDTNGPAGVSRLRFEYAASLWFSKGILACQDEFLRLLGEFESTGNRGLLFSAYYHVITNYVQLGDTESARALQVKADALLGDPGTRNRRPAQVAFWSLLMETARGFTLQRVGRIDAAERAYLAALRQGEDSIRFARNQAGDGLALGMTRLQGGMDTTRIFLAQAYTAEQRLDEAELLLRDVLKNSLVREGRNSFHVGRALFSLARVFIDRGRYAEAVVLAQWGERALEEAGISATSPVRLRSRITLATALTPAGRAEDAVRLVDAIRASLNDNSGLEDGFGQGNLMSILAYLQVGRFEDALRDGDHLLAYNTRHFGTTHYYTAEARAYRAMALNRLGRVAEARDEFAAAVQVLTDPDKVVGKEQTSLARTRRLRSILNEYLNVLVGRKGGTRAQDIAEAFRVADVARWQSVQKAVAGSALRAAAGSPELGERIKRVQDADDEMQAVYKNLITQRSAPPERQLPTVIKAMEQRIAELQKQQQRDLGDIRRQFPQYDALVNPRPASLETASRALRMGEVLVSLYVTPVGTYVWAVGRDGVPQFSFSPRGSRWIAEQVARLRASVDLTTLASFDRLRFDMEAGQALYQELLAPVQGAWSGADTLLVVANDALGQLPFSMLPTGPAAAGNATPGLPQSQFRQVPWLARQVAIAYLPSVSALVTLRALPPSAGKRDPFVGFGDPDFGSGQSSGGTRSVTGTGGTAGTGGTRNLAVKHAAAWDENQTSPDAPVNAAAPTDELPELVALPDTRAEITAIAKALAADVQRDAYFGPQASRQTVQSVDLHRRRVVAFATHGLVAGDLPGLDQPALALSPAPGKPVTDGLLRLEDILKLSLDADLVVLSACNTAAADGTGAEAVSGLGRGFFYAGARSVLATHWPVETVSARDLVTHLFEQYAKDPQLTRAQALRRAMIEVMDHDAVLDPQGRPAMAYAHPAFWAPYALYGDPGR